MVEQEPFKLLAEGSSPSALTLATILTTRDRMVLHFAAETDMLGCGDALPDMGVNMDYIYIESLADGIEEIADGSILSRTIHDDEQVRAVAFSFAPGEELSKHTSTHAAVLQFLQGEADVTVGGDAVEARAGTFIHMVPNLPHSIHARTPVVMLLLMFKSA